MSPRAIIAIVLIIFGILIGVFLATQNIGKSPLPQIKEVPLEELEMPLSEGLEIPSPEELEMLPLEEPEELEIPFF